LYKSEFFYTFRAFGVLVIVAPVLYSTEHIALQKFFLE